MTVHGQEDPRDDEVYPEQENQADQGPERLTVKALPKVKTVITSAIIVMIGTTVITSDITVTTAKGTQATRVMPCYNKTHRLKQQR